MSTSLLCPRFWTSVCIVKALHSTVLLIQMPNPTRGLCLTLYRPLSDIVAASLHQDNYESDCKCNSTTEPFDLH
ncbi:hypothetical protein INR49_012289 [Caranx melampygus]|nr:hypothetical protein INR49_012289 [Caranx melampygus]